MNDFFENLKDILKKEISILWIFSVLLGLALVTLDLKNKLPLRPGDFVFISILALCAALYRPRWAFYLFISLVPLENIILVSGFLPIQLRPYQYAGAILVVAIFILWAAKRLNFKLLKPTWLDWLVFSLVSLSFLSLMNSPVKNISLKNNLVLFSFVVLYFLVRTFVRTRRHFVETAFFFLASNIAVLVYGFYQVFADKFGRRSFEVMFGRPNATFTEADWLGIFSCFSLAVFLSMLFYFENIYEKIIVYIFLFLNLTLLILTLSRSAWIGAAAVVLFFLIFSSWKKSENKTAFMPREFAKNILAVFIISIISLAAIQFGKLSKFDIFDRARSTTTSEQKITIACEGDENVPQIVSTTNELAKYDCRHINLEEIADYKSRGKFVTEIFRKDPNVMTRGAIYRKSWEIIKQNPILGVGFGTITQTLGADERGAGLNESNIFLQIWAGTGILGLVAFITILGYLFIYAFRRISPVCPLNRFFGCPVAKDDSERSRNIFLILGISALIVPNLFNAGLLMGLFWLGLGIFSSCIFLKQSDY